MKKYYCKERVRGLFQFDDETNDLDVVDYMSTRIDWSYQVPEAGVLTYKGENGDTYTIDVKKDDIVLQFYSHPGQKNPVIVIKSKEWKQNLVGMKKYEDEQRMKQEQNSDCEGECPTCSDCCECKCASC